MERGVTRQGQNASESEGRAKRGLPPLQSVLRMLFWDLGHDAHPLKVSGSRGVGAKEKSLYGFFLLLKHPVSLSACIGLLTGKHHFGSESEMQARLELEGIIIENDQVKDFKNLFWDPSLALAL